MCGFWEDESTADPSSADLQNVHICSVPEPEPLLFSDDEPTADPVSNASSAHLPNVDIWSMPDHSSVLASEFVRHFSVFVGLKAPSPPDDAPQPHRAPIDLVAVLDVSGSMYGTNLVLLKRAMHFVICKLGPSDRLSIVTFSTTAQRGRRMTVEGCLAAVWALKRLTVSGRTNFLDGLMKGVRVLEERRHHNPVSSILFLSDGSDTCHHGPNLRALSNWRPPPAYLHLLPPSICPRNRGTEDASQQQIFPVHAFGFGLDNDHFAMQAISDSSGGTFYNTILYEFVQDAFARCIAGPLSVTIQELRLTVTSASHGVKIVSIPSGRRATEVRNLGFRCTINVGDLYAGEEKEFMINLSVPPLTEGERTSLLDVTCAYRDAVSGEAVQVECHHVEIPRPDRQLNRLRAVGSTAEVHGMVERGDLRGARDLLQNTRESLLSSPSGQLGDNLCMWLEAEVKETENRMGYLEWEQMQDEAGRAYSPSSLSERCHRRASSMEEWLDAMAM